MSVFLGVLLLLRAVKETLIEAREDFLVGQRPFLGVGLAIGTLGFFGVCLALHFGLIDWEEEVGRRDEVWIDGVFFF